MYILCKEPPSTKKTPLVYEMDRLNVCPVCGETFDDIIFDLAMKKIVYIAGHVVSKNPDFLIRERKHIMFFDRALKGAMT